MASVSILPKLFRWIFTALEALFVLGGVIVCLAILLNPRLPPDTHFGPLAIDFGGQTGSVALTAVNGDSDFTATAFRGSISLLISKAGGLFEVAKRYWLPLLLIKTILFAMLFDLLRRLFRNVGRGDSFTRQSVYLVQIVGATLIVYAIAAAIAENLLANAVLAYLAQHAVVTLSGTALHLPAPQGRGFPGGIPGSLASPVFFCGFLVLALSEVFRQGLAIKNEHDLTV